jgi:hypothetical protein
LPPQGAQHAIALLADRTQLLAPAGTFLSRNQAYITGHLLAAAKATDIADGQHERQRRAHIEGQPARLQFH